MDVLFFLKRRTAFLRRFFDAAAAPFEEVKRKIEAEVEPFVPSYVDAEWADTEPEFLSEWIDAEESLQLVGYSCICMLAASLKLCLSVWDKQLGLVRTPECRAEFKRSWFAGYQICFREHCKIVWEESGADLGLLEQIALARNSVQHENSIDTMLAKHAPSDFKKLTKRRSPVFFVEGAEMEAFDSLGGVESEWLMPRVDVTREKFIIAVQEIEKFAEWLEPRVAVWALR